MNKRRKSGPLVPGEYRTFVTGEQEDNQVLAARRRFIFAVKSAYPEFFSKLNAGAFDAYDQFVEAADIHLDGAWRLNPWSALNDLILLGGEFCETVDASKPLGDEIFEAIERLNVLGDEKQETIDSSEASGGLQSEAILALKFLADEFHHTIVALGSLEDQFCEAIDASRVSRDNLCAAIDALRLSADNQREAINASKFCEKELREVADAPNLSGDELREIIDTPNPSRDKLLVAISDLRIMADKARVAIDALNVSGSDKPEVVDARILPDDKHRKAIDALKAPGDELREAILDWARTHNSDKEDWILDGALRALSTWKQSPDWRKKLKISGFCRPVGGTVHTEPKFVFEHVGWNLQFEKWNEYRAGLDTAFRKGREAYERRSRDAAESRNEKQRQREHKHRHLEWFARYQLAGMSDLDIAADYWNDTSDTAEDIDVSTVRRGVKMAATLLNWTSLRKSPLGRPKKEAN